MGKTKFLRVNSEQRRLERYKIINTWKVLEQLAPNCGINKVENERTGRKCMLPKLSCPTRVKTMREGSFQRSGPKLFIFLPKSIINLKKVSEIEFKEIFDEFLTEIPDQKLQAQLQAASPQWRQGQQTH